VSTEEEGVETSEEGDEALDADVVVAVAEVATGTEDEI
jgi:hypothetical protein